MEQTSLGSRFVLLTGAPRCKDLSWKDTDLTVKLQESFQASSTAATQDSDATLSPPAWRELHLDPKSFHTGFSQFHYPVFLHAVDGSKDGHHVALDDSGASANTEASQSKGQVLPIEESFMTDSLSLSAIESFWSTSTSFSQHPDPSLKCAPVTDLSRLSVALERDIVAQGRSNLVNLLVIVLTVPSPQTVQIRKPGFDRAVYLLRLPVADETCTTFEISIWLDIVDNAISNAASLPNDMNPSLQKMVEGLQKHDIVLIQNVALRVFQNKIGATSIRGWTEITLLYRDYPSITQHKRPQYPIGIRSKSVVGDKVSEKIIKILDWRDAFLKTSVSANTRSKRRKVEQSNQAADALRGSVLLPADTQ